MTPYQLLSSEENKALLYLARRQNKFCERWIRLEPNPTYSMDTNIRLKCLICDCHINVNHIYCHGLKHLKEHNLTVVI